MPEIDIKQFMRKHGFRHMRDHDRGATWGNGVLDIFVEKNFAKEPGKLRSLMDQVRDGERKKIRQQKHEEQRMQKAEEKAAQIQMPVRAVMPPTTPEEHREAQIAQVRSQPPMIEYGTADTGQSRTSTSVEGPLPKVDDRKIKKLSGDERLYVYGRIKAMFQANMDNMAVAKALQAEGIILPNGKQPDSSMVGQTRWNWDKNPDRAARYAAIMMPRRKAPGAAEIPTPRPVVVAEAPKVARSRFSLPLSVDMVLQDPLVTEDEKLQVLLVFVGLPESTTVTQLVTDEKLSASQKLALVTAVGQRYPKGEANQLQA